MRNKHKQQPRQLSSILVRLIKVLGDSWLPIQPPFLGVEDSPICGHCRSCKVHSDDGPSCERVVRLGQLSTLRNGCWRGPLSRGRRCDVRADESPGSLGWRG